MAVEDLLDLDDLAPVEGEDDIEEKESGQEDDEVPLTQEQARYLTDDAIGRGIPIELVDRFLAENPNDQARLISALSEGYLTPAGEEGRVAIRESFGYDTQGIGQLAPQMAYANQSSMISFDPQLVAGLPTGTVAEQFMLGGSPLGTGDWRAIVGTGLGLAATLIPGIGPGLAGVMTGLGSSLVAGSNLAKRPVSLPLPGGGIGMPTNIPITIGRTGGMKPATIAKIAAAAAALGISAEEYYRLYGSGEKKRRTMNPLNFKALRRAGGRVDKFVCIARKMIHTADHSGYKHASGRKKRSCSKKRSC